MIWNKHSNLEGTHAFLSPSKYSWINYDENRLLETFANFNAAQRGTELHAFAAPEPADHQPLPGTAFALHDAALAVTVDQLATTGRARRDGIIALNIKNRLPHCV